MTERVLLVAKEAFPGRGGAGIEMIFVALTFFLTGMLIFTACENDFNGTGLEESLLPDQLTVEIPSALSHDVTAKKSAQVDTLKGGEIYRHLSNAADRGDEAANVIADVVVKMT